MIDIAGEGGQDKLFREDTSPMLDPAFLAALESCGLDDG